MSPPTSPALQRLHRLDRSSSDFHDQLHNVLRGEEYVQCEENLEGDDLVWLIDYLDKVRRHLALLRLLLSQCRLSPVSILPAQLPGSVCASSETYAAPGCYSQHRTLFRFTPCKLIPNHSPPEVPVTCTGELSAVQRFVSNVSGHMLRMFHKRRLRCVLNALVFSACHH